MAEFNGEIIKPHPQYRQQQAVAYMRSIMPPVFTGRPEEAVEGNYKKLRSDAQKYQKIILALKEGDFQPYSSELSRRQNELQSQIKREEQRSKQGFPDDEKYHQCQIAIRNLEKVIQSVEKRTDPSGKRDVDVLQKLLSNKRDLLNSYDRMKSCRQQLDQLDQLMEAAR